MFVRLIAGILALLAFSSAIVAGLLAGNPFETILSRAWLTMIAFFILGAIAGAIVQAVVDEHQMQKMLAQQQAEENAQDVQQEESSNNTSQAEPLTN